MQEVYGRQLYLGFAGLSIDVRWNLNITPKMPKEWEGVTFRIHYLNSWLEISIDAKNNAAVKVLEGHKQM